VDLAGFTTGEIREGGQRVGFEIEGLAGATGVLAHVDLPGPPRIGKYGVDVAALDAIALPELQRPTEVVVIDELGKMELGSRAFREAVSRVFDAGDVTIVATVHAGTHPFTDALERRPDIEVVRVTQRNRDLLPERLAARLVARP
jgi:nucleoside-triphosphatase